MVLIDRYLPDHDDPDAPKVDADQATRAIVRYLYQNGKYEQWCRDYDKDPDRYWTELFGQSYAAHQRREPVVQKLRDQDGDKKRGLKRFYELF